MLTRKCFISRWWQSKGFGIQSKTDYAFLHDVINERLPYYAYEDLDLRFSQCGGVITTKERETARLLFRVVNAIKPKEIITTGSPSEFLLAHLYAAPRGSNGRLLYAEDGEKVLTSHGYKAVIMSNIDNTNQTKWEHLLQTEAITYDLRDVGIAIFYPHRTAEHYYI